MSRKDEQFWMVKGDGSPTMKHRSRSSAEAEARRLAQQNPGTQFFVLEAVSAWRRLDMERVTFGSDPDDMIPF